MRDQKVKTSDRVLELHREYPEWTFTRIAGEVGCSRAWVSKILSPRSSRGKKRVLNNMMYIPENVEYISSREAAAILGVDAQTVNKLHREGLVSGSMNSVGHMRYSFHEIDQIARIKNGGAITFRNAVMLFLRKKIDDPSFL